MPHDPDVKVLPGMAVTWNIPIACNRATADCMISSPLIDGQYDPLILDYEAFRTLRIPCSETSAEIGPHAADTPPD